MQQIVRCQEKCCECKPAYPVPVRIEILRAKRFVKLGFVEFIESEATVNELPEPALSRCPYQMWWASHVPEGRTESDLKILRLAYA